MDHFEKFLRPIDAHLRRRVIEAAEEIVRGEFGQIDIQRMRGNDHLYRCRVGDVRILFYRGNDGQFLVLDADFRGRIYKKRHEKRYSVFP